MRDIRVKTQKHQGHALLSGFWLTGALLATLLAFVPVAAQASTDGWWPHFGKGSALPGGFWLTGEVTAIEEGSVTVQLPNRDHARGFMRYVSLQVTLDVDSNSLLLDEELGALELTTLAEGDEVVVMPRLVWGNLVTRLLYVGEPQDLSEASYYGNLVADAGDTLTLENRREGEFTVLVDENTRWYDEGQMVRPTELPEDIALRVLGIAEENDAGDEVIRAVVITPGK